jgi:hypothetical protein
MVDRWILPKIFILFMQLFGNCFEHSVEVYARHWHFLVEFMLLPYEGELYVTQKTYVEPFH